MKKILLAFGILLFFSSSAFAQYSKEEYMKDRKVCYSSYNSNCFYKLTVKYGYQKEYANFSKYEYAMALIAEKDHMKARTILQGIVTNEKNNQELVDYAKKAIEKINEHQRNINKADWNDTGNYYNQSQSIRWKNPKNIKVYIKGNTGKEYLYKTAFRTWANKSGTILGITFVSNEDEANIVCSYVNYLSDSHAGITYTKHIIMPDGKKYITKADVRVSLTNQNGGKYTDRNLESIVLHEIGHALGITYHSSNINDIMYYSTETYKNGFLSNRDVNTLKMIYAK